MSRKSTPCHKCHRPHSFRWDGVKYCWKHWGERWTAIRQQAIKEKRNG